MKSKYSVIIYSYELSNKNGINLFIFIYYMSYLNIYRYQIFGDVFEEAVRLGLPAVQTQHPGFYYQQAAQYAVLRRKTALQVCKVWSSFYIITF